MQNILEQFYCARNYYFSFSDILVQVYNVSLNKVYGSPHFNLCISLIPNEKQRHLSLGRGCHGLVSKLGSLVASGQVEASLILQNVVNEN